MANPTADELREHVACEVHYLVLAAVRFTEVTGTEKAVYQDSSLLHALTLSEFTNPGQKTNYTWWIGDVGGQKPLGKMRATPTGVSSLMRTRATSVELG